jgi:threonine/homoserine/homoserine lactone efflux protein
MEGSLAMNLRRFMMTDHSLLAYTGIVALLVLTPGPNAALILRTAGFRGRAAGFSNLAGIVSGFYFHALCSALGLSLILLRSANLYTAVKLIGAAYLVYLGIKTLRQAFAADGVAMAPSAQERAAANGMWNAYLEGLLTNVLNPKVALFYLSLLPQFIQDPESVLTQSLLLASIHAVLASLWFSLLTLLFGKFGNYVGNSGLKRKLQAATGAAFIGLGIKIAMADRP